MDGRAIIKACILGGVILSAVYAAYLSFWMAVEIVGEWRRARRWCRRNGFRLRTFEFGPGRMEFDYVGEDETNGLLWVIPFDYGEPVRCVRVGYDGEIEFYEPKAVGDAESRSLLTWAAVWEVAKVVLLAAAKAGVVKLVEIVLEKLKDKWGIRSGATEERVEAVTKSEIEGMRSFLQVGEYERDLAKETIVEIIRYAKRRGLKKSVDFHENDIANIRLSISEWEKGRKGRDGENGEARAVNEAE